MHRATLGPLAMATWLGAAMLPAVSSAGSVTGPSTSTAGRGPAGASSVTLTMVPQGSSRAGLGAPFEFRVRADNSDPAPVDMDVVFTIAPAAGGPAIPFARWAVSVPGAGQTETTISVVSAQWFPDTGPYVATGGDPSTGATASLTFDVGRPSVVVPRFRDATAGAGLVTTQPAPTCWRYGAGAAWGDVDGDGDPDLYVPVEDGPSQLWMNDGSGHFTDEAVARGADDGGAIGMGAVFVDEDSDGHQDLYVVNDGPNRLYRNDGTGHFSDLAPRLGLADAGHGPSASWADYDGDGLLDLYVTNYIGCGGAGSDDALLHHEVDGAYTNRIDLLGPPGTTGGAGFQAAWFDEDGDGDPDLYLVNDVVNQENDGNHLWRNDGASRNGWSFTDVTDRSGLGFAVNSMGIGLGDYDGDLDLDVAVSNINGNLLAANQGGTFRDMADRAGIRRALQTLDHPAITWGLGFFDLNLDGWEDLYVAGGDIFGAEPQPNQLFVSRGPGGGFLDLSAPGGADSPAVGRGVAFADLDRDGRIDLYVMNQRGSPILYRNVTPYGHRHWMEVELTGTAGARDACGGRVLFTVHGRRMLRQVSCGSISVGSGADHILHVGLGASPRADRIDVFWPSGRHQVIRHVAGDRVVAVNEPEGPP